VRSAGEPVIGAVVAALLAGPAALHAQAPAAARSEIVTYQNPVDGLPLSAQLFLPPGEGPFSGVVLLTLAGAGELIERLTDLGWAVLMSERRGIATIEHLLRASFDDLAIDVRAGADYLRRRPEVDATRVGLIAQGGETMAALLAAVEPPLPAFVVLLSTTGLPGDQSFRIEQRQIALYRNYDTEALAALDDFVVQLTEMVIAEPSLGLRASRMRPMLEGSDVRLPRSASFPPNPEDQVRFFASRWWRDLFLFRPDLALAKLAVPTLVVMGDQDPITPYQEHLPAIAQRLAEAPTQDATACLVTGLVRHSITPPILAVLERWLGDRLTADGFVSHPGARPGGCIEAPLR